jgi:hypothetical protein
MMNDIKQLAQTMLVKIARDAVKRVLVKKAYGTGAPTMGGMPAVKDWSSKGSMRGVKALSTSPTGALNKQASPYYPSRTLRPRAWKARRQALSGVSPTWGSNGIGLNNGDARLSTPLGSLNRGGSFPAAPAISPFGTTSNFRGGIISPLPGGPNAPLGQAANYAAPGLRPPSPVISDWQQTAAKPGQPGLDGPTKGVTTPSTTGTGVIIKGQNGQPVLWRGADHGSLEQARGRIGNYDPVLSFSGVTGMPRATGIAGETGTGKPNAQGKTGTLKLKRSELYDLARSVGPTSRADIAAARRASNAVPEGQRDSNWQRANQGIQRADLVRGLLDRYHQSLGPARVGISGTAVRDNLRAQGAGVQSIDSGGSRKPMEIAEFNRQRKWQQEGINAINSWNAGRQEAPSQYQIAQTAYKMSGPATGQMSPEQRAAMLRNVSQQSTLRGSGLRSRV